MKARYRQRLRKIERRLAQHTSRPRAAFPPIMTLDAWEALAEPQQAALLEAARRDAAHNQPADNG